MYGSADEPLEAILDGKKLGHYRIEALIGRGGMGVVFRARDTHLGRRVAIKVLEGNATRQEVTFQRFVQEARLAAALSHPNVVTIHEVNQQDQHVYIVMELLDGGSVQERLEKHGRLEWSAAAQTLSSVCRGLDAAHARGLIHRDIKPGNILADRSGVVKLGDFGLARRSAETASSLTTVGMVIGTPHYMSPEQCEGQKADRRSDVYSMGATFHALLTGSPPFPGPEPLQVAFAHCSAPPPDPRGIDDTIPASCSAIVQRAMAKRPGDRHQSAAEMLAELTNCLGDAASSPPMAQLTIQTARPASRTKIRTPTHRYRWVLAMGIAFFLSAALFTLFVFSIASPIAGLTQQGPTSAGADDDPVPIMAARGAESDSKSDTPASVDASARVAAERLTALFAEPTRDEVRNAAAEWRNIAHKASTGRAEGRRLGRMQVVSRRVEGGRHYAIVRYPEDSSSQEKFATIIFLRGGDSGFSPFDMRMLKMCVPALDECMVLMPIFRGQSMNISRASRPIHSDGSRGNVVTESTDVIGLLNVVSHEISQFDPSRVLVLGTGDRSPVALQLGFRDRRIRAVIATEADTDCFHVDVRAAIAEASDAGIAPETRLARTVWNQVAQPFLAGTGDLSSARRELLSLSPAQFVHFLPPTQLYYGVFSDDYEMQQGYQFRDRYLEHGRWKQYFVCRQFPAGPSAPPTIRGMHRSASPLIRDVIDGAIKSPQRFNLRSLLRNSSLRTP